MMLDVNLRAAENIIKLSRDIARRTNCRSTLPTQEELEIELQQHTNTMKDHQRRIKMLLESLNNTSLLVSIVS